MTPLDSLKLEINPTATATTDDFESDGPGPRSPMQISTGDAPSQATSEDGDAVWSILSNTFFVSGGSIYLLGATWSYAIYSKTDDPDNLDLHSVLSALAYAIYQAVWIMGPLVYFLNSIIDVKWALIVKARSAARKSYLEKLKAGTPATLDQSGTGGLLSNLLRRMKRNVGSRRSLGAACTFGLGAFMGLLAAVLGLKATITSLGQGEIDSLYAWAAALGSGSTHMYLVSAILALWKPPSAWLAMCNPSSTGGTGNVAAGSTVAGSPWYSNPRTLFNYGDVLFGSAAVIDVCLADASIDDGFLSLPIASSLLWTMDALLYLRGDYCTFYLQTKIENDTSDNATPAPDVVEEIV